MKDQISKAIFPHYLIAGLGMVLLVCVWAFGWKTSPAQLYDGLESPALMLILISLVLAGWSLLSCVIAAGFFHAASKHPAKTFNAFRNASIRLMLLGTIFLFPVPVMTYVLGSEMTGRALALVITGISLAGIVFGRARIKVIERHLTALSVAEEREELTPLK